jgi:hypothetical protein
MGSSGEIADEGNTDTYYRCYSASNRPKIDDGNGDRKEVENKKRNLESRKVVKASDRGYKRKDYRRPIHPRMPASQDSLGTQPFQKRRFIFGRHGSRNL